MSSEPPETYWRPFLGDVCNLRPCDLGGLTPYQLDECRDYFDAKMGA